MITAIVGLPGSGKTELGRKLSIITGLPFYDDISPSRDFPQDCIVDTPYFCRESTRIKFRDMCEKRGISVEYIFFENNPIQCIKNARKRATCNVEPDIRSMTRTYNPPENALPVWRGNAE